MPISSRASQNYLQILSLRYRPNFSAHLHVQKQRQAHLRNSYCQPGSPCPSTERRYATAASRTQPNGLSQGPSNLRRTFKDHAPDNPSRRSASGVKQAFRSNQIQRQQKKQASRREESKEDPDAIERMADTLIRQAGVDKWAIMDIDILDTELPVRNNLPFGLNQIKYYWDNLLNIVKSAVGAYQIVSGGLSPPLYSIPDFPYRSKVQPPLPPVPNEINWYNPSHIYNLLRFSSTSPKAWLAGISGLSLDLYMQMCKAIAENDKVTLKKVTGGAQLEHALQVINKQHRGVAYSWKFVKENSPTRIVSIRCADIGQRPPPGLTPLAINALVRFDTTQSLEISAKKSTKDSRSAISASPDKVMQKRVLEYYVVQKRGWVKEPWSIKARIYDTSGFPEEPIDDGNNESDDGTQKASTGVRNSIIIFFKRKFGRH